jgi:hypothetical protein
MPFIRTGFNDICGAKSTVNFFTGLTPRQWRESLNLGAEIRRQDAPQLDEVIERTWERGVSLDQTALNGVEMSGKRASRKVDGLRISDWTTQHGCYFFISSYFRGNRAQLMTSGETRLKRQHLGKSHNKDFLEPGFN